MGPSFLLIAPMSPTNGISRDRFSRPLNASYRWLEEMAGTTRLELATSAVTGQRSNQLNYVPALGTAAPFDSKRNSFTRKQGQRMGNLDVKWWPDYPSNGDRL